MNDRERRHEETRLAIQALAASQPALLGFDTDNGALTASISLLGVGESYAAWLLRGHQGTTRADRVIRVAWRPLADMPCDMADEFVGLSLVPAGLGPAPIYLDATERNPLGRAYIVTGFVPGRTLPPTRWTTRILHRHAQQLATLHATSFPGHGSVRNIDQGRRDFSLSAGFADALNWWRETHPELMRQPDVADLAGKAIRFLAERHWACESLTSYALVHGDLVATNVVVDQDGTPRFIDWEWVVIGDPAQDLAYIGGHVSADPWYVPLSLNPPMRSDDW